MDNILELFPAVNDSVIFRVSPDSSIGLIPYPGLYLNVTDNAWQVYKLCDGSLPLKNIIMILSEKWTINENVFINFIKDAVDRGYIKLLNKKTKRNLDLKGDFKYYYPAVVSLIVTTKCNLRCSYCYGNFNPGNNEFIPSHKVENLFKTLSGKGLIGIELTGGEPLTHPEFPNILKLALENILFVVVLSNGVLFTDEIFDILLKNKQKICVQISIDGLNEITNSKVRQVANTWQQTLNTINRLVELGINLKVAYILTPENVKDLRETAGLMKLIGVKNFSVSFAEGLGRGSNLRYEDNFSFNNSKSKHFMEVSKVISAVREEFKEIMPDLDKKFAGDPYFSNNLDSNCGAGWNSVSIYPDGSVTACPLLEKMIVMGNIFSDDITDIFNGHKINEFYRTFSKGRVDDTCSECEYNNYCFNCLTRIVLANKELLSKGKKICKFAEKYEMDKIFNDFKYAINFHI